MQVCIENKAEQTALLICRFENTCGQEHRKDHWGIRTRIHWFFNWKWIYRQYFTHKVVGCFWLSMPACLMHHTHFTAFKHTFLPRDGYAPGPSPTFSLFTACCPSCHTTISQGSQLPSPHSPRIKPRSVQIVGWAAAFQIWIEIHYQEMQRRNFWALHRPKAHRVHLQWNFPLPTVAPLWHWPL